MGTESLNKFRLISLLKECTRHLENSDDYSPILSQTLNGLHEHMSHQGQILQTQLKKLQQERDEAMRQTMELKKQQQQQHSRQSTVKSAHETKPPSSSSSSSSTTSSNNSKLSALEQQKRAAAEKRRQQVIEERRKAALEQKRKEEEEKRKFLEYEKRKEAMKTAAAVKANTNSKAKISLKDKELKIQKEAMSALNGIGGKSSSSNSTTEVDKERILESNLSSPNQQVQQPSPRDRQEPPPQPPRTQHPPTERDLRYSIPKNDATVSVTESSTDTATVNQETKIPSQPVVVVDNTELKRQILITWALQPPDYQVLKRIDELVCTIHTVFPPFFGTSSHAYFKDWDVFTLKDLYSHHPAAAAAGGMVDRDKVKKAVRKLRVFLHPDKLPRDFTDQQLFVCKLLWDVTNDSMEDFKAQMTAR